MTSRIPAIPFKKIPHECSFIKDMLYVHICLNSTGFKYFEDMSLFLTGQFFTGLFLSVFSQDIIEKYCICAGYTQGVDYTNTELDLHFGRINDKGRVRREKDSENGIM